MQATLVTPGDSPATNAAQPQGLDLTPGATNICPELFRAARPGG